MTIGRLHKATSKVAVPLVTNTTSAAVQTVSDCLSVSVMGRAANSGCAKISVMRLRVAAVATGSKNCACG